VIRRAVVAIGCFAFVLAFFAPVMFQGLVIGDAVDQLIEALPMYAGPHHLWEPLAGLGYPASANPLSVQWYPLAYARLLGLPYDLYECAAYAIAMLGAYALARVLTGSVVGSLAAALVFGLDGFAIGHAGHIGLLHSAAWVPWIFVALVRLRASGSPRWIAGGACAVALSTLGGQPQVCAYALLLAAAYAMVFARGAFGGPIRYIATVAATVALGIALAAIEVLPALEMTRESVRARIAYEAFVGFATPLVEVPIRLLFPYLLGRTQIWPYTASDFDIGSFAEMSLYVGIITLSLATIAIVPWRRAGGARFWFVAALVSLALTTGGDLGLAQIAYNIPVLNWFRAPGRHALEFGLSAAMLAAYGIAHLERERFGTKHVLLACAPAGVALAAVLAVLAMMGATLPSLLARAFGTAQIPPDVLSLRNAALWIPALVFAAGVGALLTFAARPQALAARVLVLAVIALDLSSFAWFGYWNWGAFSPDLAAKPTYAVALQRTVVAGGQRIYSVPSENVRFGLPPNLNILWGIPGARSYSQLEALRAADFLRAGEIDQLRLAGTPKSSRFDAAGIRYVIVPRGDGEDRPLDDPFSTDQDLGLVVGPRTPVTGEAIRLTQPRAADAIGVVFELPQAPDIRDDVPIGELSVTTGDGRTQAVTILARHGPRSVVRLGLHSGTTVRELRLRWRGPATRAATLVIHAISLLDSRSERAHPVTARTYLEDDPGHWKRSSGGEDVDVFENTTAFARAWIVHRAEQATTDHVLDALNAPGFNFQTTAVLEGAPPPLAPALGPESAHLMHLTPESMALETVCSANCLLVTSDVTYPGWSVSVDGHEEAVRAADFAFRAVALPPGRHTVVFKYVSRTLRAGALLSGLAVVAIVLLAFRFRRTAGPENAVR
jgi:energy-converting hydrogenase Eha subunit A